MIKKFQLTAGSPVAVESQDAPVLMYINPDAAEREDLLTLFGIDAHSVSSALDADEVPRFEVHPDYSLLIWKRPRNYSGEAAFFFDVTSIGLVLRKDRLIIIVAEDIPLLTAPGHWHTAESLLDVLLGQLFSMIHHYHGHLRVISTIARELQQKINSSLENEHLIQMFNLSESLVFYLNAINANGAVLTRLRNYIERGTYSGDVIAFIDDLIIENNQCYKQAEIYSTVFSGLMDARGNLVNNNMNVLLRNLTLINVVFLPLNLIASIGGMSEFSMMTQDIDWRISYPLFTVLMVVIGVLTAVVLKRSTIATRLIKAQDMRRKPVVLKK